MGLAYKRNWCETTHTVSSVSVAAPYSPSADPEETGLTSKYWESYNKTHTVTNGVWDIVANSLITVNERQLSLNHLHTETL